MAFFRDSRRRIGRQILAGCRRLKDLFVGKPALPGIDAFPRKILIIRPYFLGDILLCLPIVQAIRQQRKDAHITWLLRKEWQSLLQDHAPVDEVIPFSQQRMHSPAAIGEFLRVARELRKRSFELVLNLSWDRSSVLWSWISGAPVRVGIEEYGRPRLLSLLHTVTVQAPERSQDDRHMADFYYDPLRLLGFEPRSGQPHVAPTAPELDFVDTRLKANFGKMPSFLLVHPGGRLAYKRWPVERFAGLLDRLEQQTAHVIIVACGPGEEPWASALVAKRDSGRFLFWPSPSLGELMALARGATLFIGNDSGPMHLAAACGCRVVAIVGADSPRWLPLGEGHLVVRDPQGLEKVSVSQVVEMVNQEPMLHL